MTPRYVVGIGASAGGLDPLTRFFDGVPAQTGIAFVVVQHLSPDFKSLMDELLARHTPLPIRLVEDGMQVEADHVYLIPPRKEMIIAGGRLLLSESDRQQELHLPIDVFFRSLAQDCGPRAIAIVLSGGGSDGSRGICDVHAAGGLVIVQDAETAQFDGMPRAARDTGVVDHVLAPEDMPRVVLEHVRAPAMPAAAPPVAAPTEAQGIAAVYRMLQDEFGIDFTHYKPSTVTRRIERRLALARSQDIGEYLQRLRDDRDELDTLYRDLLIGVTRFFRDEPAFEAIERVVLPDLLQRSGDRPLRVWVAGCATGEEAYSVAILLQEALARFGDRPLKIFATDVHRGSLEHAARGVYGQDAVARVSPERLARYFVRTATTYQVVPELRQMIVFAAHNVIRDAPFTHVDLITCRNLLIYLQPAAQQRVLSLFHFALNRGGILVLGPSESPGVLGGGFEVVDRHWQIYRKQADVRPPVETRRLTPASEPRPEAAPAALPPVRRPTPTQLLATYDALLDEFMPPGFLVNDRGELVQTFGGASRFLRVRDGRLGLDVLDLVEDELRIALVGGLTRALREPSAIVFNGVRVGAGGDADRYRVTLRRLRGRSGDTGHVLVSFEPTRGAAPGDRGAETEVDLDEVSRRRIDILEAELAYTKQTLQAAIEEREASNEELQASYEELQASNEELQSTNEELQSVNEELYTVNAEYQRKITELTELTNDMDNLLSSTDIGTIFLDAQLRIRKFTPKIAETFDLVPHDIGRPIEAFAHTLEHPGLGADLARVLETGQTVERELRDARGKAFFLRVLPYRVKGAVDGVVVTVIDISGLRAAEDALFHERHLLNSLLRTVPDAIYFKDARGRFIRANPAMARRLGLADPADAVGKTAFDLPDPQAALALQREDDAVLHTGEPQHYRLERRAGPDGREVWDLVTRLPLRDPDGRIVGIIVIFRDVTAQKQAEDKIHEAVRRRDQFLAMLSHELRNPLGAMATALELLRTDGAPGVDRARVLDILTRQTGQMTRLLDDLLEASRVTQNKIELRRRTVDLTAIARQAADAARLRMEAQGLRFTTRIAAEPIHVDGDPSRLEQIHANLLSNAAKYTPRGGEVVLEVGCEPDGMAAIRVRDTGVGLPPHMLESVFDLFVQSSRTLDRAGGGLGLGLTVVRSLAAMHGGTVAAHSDGEGKGSEFVVRIPVVRGSRPPRLTGLQEDGRPTLAPGESMTVVVVEDNADSREMLCALLRQAGVVCHATDSGTAALELIDEVSPQVVILDVGLPGMDGFGVARRVRANPRHAGVRLIALTGYGQAADREAAREAGFDLHLVKPVDGPQLLRLVLGAAGETARAS
ncbi:MAG TPA: chemotaxis protein CheB [Candidatus Tectomicrobia bacterium]|nr:chemotaxis protein CheB [Candidatus Tectomicrobia bacterium]